VIDPIRWWHSHNVRLRLTVWYVAAMVVVLAVYAGAIYTFVSRSVSDSLDQRLRADFFWAAATVDEGADGLVMSTPQVDLLLEEEPWVQVWSADGGAVLYGNAEAGRRPIPGTKGLAAMGQDRVATADSLCKVVDMRRCANDLNAVDKNGETVMHGAAYKHVPAVVHFLAEKGAKIEVWNQPNKRGWTPLKIAEGVQRGMNIVSSVPTAAAISEVMAAAGTSTKYKVQSAK